MPRRPRSSQAGHVFHALNRGNCRMSIFDKPADYLAFLKLMEEGRQRVGARILAYCLMPNHWHIVLWPRRAEDLSDYFRWVSTTHVRRWRAHRKTAGEGHLYQGRFKSFPIQQDSHLLTAMRYVEANPVRAGLVKRAEDWPYSSLWAGDCPAECRVTLDAPPVPRPSNWRTLVNRPLPPSDLEPLQISVNRGRPYGGDRWISSAAKTMNLASTLRGPGRPRKPKTVAKKPKNV
ncbi:MAG: transposase [Phycisphaeraceae bacterium]|nr:transposase [Phycisphaeraceae bacterium]